MIGVVGPYHFSNKINEEVCNFLWKELKLEVTLPTGIQTQAQTHTKQGNKNKITHIGREHAKFLCHYIKLPTPRDIITQHSKYNSELENTKFSPSILIPLNDLKSKLIEKGFADDTGRPKFIGKYIFLSDYDIVKEYNRILTKILTFYSRYWKANKYSHTDSQRVGAYTLAPLPTLPPKGGSLLREGGMKGKGLGKIIYILEFSLAHTLSAKHRTSLPKIFKKYGRPFVVSRTESDSIVFAKPERLKS